MLISPLDGRYGQKIKEIQPIFSELGLARYRTKAEVEWLIFLSDKDICPPLSAQEILNLRALVTNFSSEQFAEIKQIEAKTNHDVKAIELFLRSKTDVRFHPFIHFGCTSEDINSASYAMMLRDGATKIRDFLVENLLPDLKKKAQDWKAVPMLGRTHGQSATPTTLGKEFAVFYKRLMDLFAAETIKFSAKFSGATGNFAAHMVACPDQDWIELSQEFVKNRLGLTWSPLATQIEPHDNVARLLNDLGVTSTIFIDLCRDIWGYISLGYFGQKVVVDEVGSSTMPHKVNPIDFENAEGNFKLSRGLGRTLADELPISRWQRDLTDSTMQRNLGIVFGHFLLALKSLKKGLDKLELKPEALKKDLEDNPEVLTEAIQTVMRKYRHADAYEQLKEFSRGKHLTMTEIHEFISHIDIHDVDKDLLRQLTAEQYIGASVELVDRFVK